MKEVVYLLVHFNDFDLTKKCIDHLLKLENKNDINITIVCVDNCSTNNSVNMLEETYNSCNQVYIAKNSKDESYADGLNFGLKYIKNELCLNPMAIVTLNNDLFIEDIEFNDKLYEFFCENEDYDIICPDIRTGEKRRPQNPLRAKPHSTSHIYKLYIYSRICIFLTYIPIIRKYVGRKFRKSSIVNTKITNELIDFDYTSFIPHGACIIYRPNWFNNNDYLLISIGFHCGEEEIFYEYLYDYKMIFAKNLQVFHVGEGTIGNQVGRNISYKKVRELYSRTYKSCKYIYKLRKQHKKR